MNLGRGLYSLHLLGMNQHRCHYLLLQLLPVSTNFHLFGKVIQHFSNTWPLMSVYSVAGGERMVLPADRRSREEKTPYRLHATPTVSQDAR